MTDHMLSAEVLKGEDVLAHIGVIRRSGRYPWGSGNNPHQRNNTDFLSEIKKLKEEGLSEKDIAQGFGISIAQLRNAASVARNQNLLELQGRALQLKESGMSINAIGRELGKNESSIRSLLDPALMERRAQLANTANMLKGQIEEKQFLDIGKGVAQHVGVNPDKLRTAVSSLEQEGYETFYIKVKQLGTGKYTTVKVLGPPGSTYREAAIAASENRVGSISDYSEDNGRSFLGLKPITNVSSDRLQVRYGSEGGDQKDGVIELRRGVDDLDMGAARYAQVRIGVDGKKYLKGMAVYADDLPDGVDIRFNTNKEDSGNKLDALKPMKTTPDGKVDKDNPFGAQIKPGGQRGALNIVNEEGDWQDWSKSLPSQMLSKQSKALAEQQLDQAYQIRKDELNEINSLTNPVVKKKLLQAYADGADSAAVHLKAAALPRQATHVILPLSSVKETEVFAPKYNDGDQVALIRFPHGGTFEIPVLTVNNRNAEAKRIMAQARDAIGIHAKVAEQLSGADFDGDTVLVIPTGPKSRINAAPPLPGLQKFDPKSQYREKPGMKVMTPRGTQIEMGKISNLINDMTILGAPHSEIERAVKHSMVVIDAEKHKLDYLQSAKDNNISALKTKYQGGPNAGAATLISRSTSETNIPKRKPRPAAEGGAVDKETGELQWVPTGESYVNRKGQTVVKSEKIEKGALAKDAFELVSKNPQPMEVVYATHANRMKALANEARRIRENTPNIPQDKKAKETYASQVDSLNHKLNVALKNAPLERKAQLLANSVVNIKRQANPNMDQDDIRKAEFQALAEARLRTGADKARIQIDPQEWNAIQAGAISSSKLASILDNSDLDQVKQLATPREATVVTPARMRVIQNMLNNGYTQAEIASHLGIPASTVDSALDRA